MKQLSDTVYEEQRSTLCIHLNRLMGNLNFLQIKALAFPNSHRARLGYSLLITYHAHMQCSVPVTPQSLLTPQDRLS